jgi:hypothetical protein
MEDFNYLREKLLEESAKRQMDIKVANEKRKFIDFIKNSDLKKEKEIIIKKENKVLFFLKKIFKSF